MGSEIRTSKTKNNEVIAKIIGDFTPLQSPADLSNKFLMKPTRP